MLRIGLVGLAGLMLLAAGIIVWQTIRQVGTEEQPSTSAATPGALFEREPDPREYVVFFEPAFDLAAQRAVLARHSAAKIVGPGKFPGVIVVMLTGSPERALADLRGESAIVTVQKATKGMLCH